jgi:hypothetical protein
MTSAIAVKQSKAADTRYPFIQNVFYLVVRSEDSSVFDNRGSISISGLEI